MKNQNYNITDTEYTIMKYLWSLDHDATAREIRDHFSQRNWSKQTVSTFLKRLVKSGYLKMYIASPTKYYYKVLISEKEHTILPVREIIKNSFNDSFSDFVCAFVNPKNELSQEEIEYLNNMIDNLDNETVKNDPD